MVHGRTDGDTGGHLVVEETSDFIAEDWSDGVVGCVVVTGFRGIDGAGEIALEEIEDGVEFLLAFDDDGEGGVAKDLALQVVRGGEELCSGGAEECVGVAVAFAGCVFAARDKLGASFGERGHSIVQLLAAYR